MTNLTLPGLSRYNFNCVSAALSLVSFFSSSLHIMLFHSMLASFRLSTPTSLRIGNKAHIRLLSILGLLVIIYLLAVHLFFQFLRPYSALNTGSHDDWTTEPDPSVHSISKSPPRYNTNSTSGLKWTTAPISPPPKPPVPEPDPHSASLIQKLLYPFTDNPQSDPSTNNPSQFHSDDNT